MSPVVVELFPAALLRVFARDRPEVALTITLRMRKRTREAQNGILRAVVAVQFR
jgi:hypothetical protein